MLKEEDAVEQLEAFQVGEKRIALQALVNMDKVAQYSDEIAKLLDDEDAPVRKEAALTLGKAKPSSNRHGQSIARTLENSLMDEDKGVRAEAVRAIGALGRDAGAASADRIEKLLSKEREDEPGVAAVEALAALGEAARLGSFLSSPNPNVVRAALVEAGRSPEARTKFAGLLRERLGHQDTSVRLAAVQASSELGGACSEAHLHALAGLRSSDRFPKVRRAAVQALGKAGPIGVPFLVNYFHDADEGVRHFAAETLGGIPGEDTAAAAAELLEHPDAPVRVAALMTLGRLKVDGRDRAPAVAERLHDPDHAARLAAIQALSDLGASTEARLVGALCRDPNKGIRQAAVNALAKMGADGAEQALPFMDDEDQAVRQAAVKVYSPLHSKLPADLALPHSGAVCGKLSDKDWRVRFAAVVALGDLHVGQYANQVAILCTDENEQVRRSAIHTLVKMNATAAHVAAFLRDDDDRVRKEAELAHAERATNGTDYDGELSECD